MNKRIAKKTLIRLFCGTPSGKEFDRWLKAHRIVGHSYKWVPSEASCDKVLDKWEKKDRIEYHRLLISGRAPGRYP